MYSQNEVMSLPGQRVCSSDPITPGCLHPSASVVGRQTQQEWREEGRGARRLHACLPFCLSLSPSIGCMGPCGALLMNTDIAKVAKSHAHAHWALVASAVG